jgi:response regulator RpfG family c-di-GMP phosphodiesterase
MQIIMDAKGSHFDPELTDIFLANSAELIQLREIFQKQETEEQLNNSYQKNSMAN